MERGPDGNTVNKKSSPKAEKSGGGISASARFFDPSGSWFGSPRCPENGDVQKVANGQRKSPLSGWEAAILWLRGLDLNQTSGL